MDREKTSVGLLDEQAMLPFPSKMSSNEPSVVAPARPAVKFVAPAPGKALSGAAPRTAGARGSNLALNLHPDLPIKGRGALANLQSRFAVHGRERFDDGWTVPLQTPASQSASQSAALSIVPLPARPRGQAPRQEQGEAASLKTVVTDEIARSILSRNNSPDIPFGVSLNPYRGCEHVM